MFPGFSQLQGELGGFLLCKESVISLLPCHLATLRRLSIFCLSQGISMLVQQLSGGGSGCSHLQYRQQQCWLEQQKFPDALCTRDSPVLL